MIIETMRAVLGWCSIINMGLLLWWFFAIMVLCDWVYKFHSNPLWENACRRFYLTPGFIMLA
jgi:hypothetical protein